MKTLKYPTSISPKVAAITVECEQDPGVMTGIRWFINHSTVGKVEFGTFHAMVQFLIQLCDNEAYDVSKVRKYLLPDPETGKRKEPYYDPDAVAPGFVAERINNLIMTIMEGSGPMRVSLIKGDKNAKLLLEHGESIKIKCLGLYDLMARAIARAKRDPHHWDIDNMMRNMNAFLEECAAKSDQLLIDRVNQFLRGNYIR